MKTSQLPRNRRWCEHRSDHRDCDRCGKYSGCPYSGDRGSRGYRCGCWSCRHNYCRCGCNCYISRGCGFMDDGWHWSRSRRNSRPCYRFGMLFQSLRQIAAKYNNNLLAGNDGAICSVVSPKKGQPDPTLMAMISNLNTFWGMISNKTNNNIQSGTQTNLVQPSSNDTSLGQQASDAIRAMGQCLTTKAQ